MSEKVLMKGNEALSEAAIRAGCRHFFGYPITPSSEILEYLAFRLPQIGGTFLQSESEVAAINMVYGAAAAGARVMTASSSPGVSLMQEGISYAAAAELPCLVVNVTRASPGLGRIPPAQSDYWQATRGGGHGDYHLIVLAPFSVQEMADLTILAFDLADKYRNPAMILADGMLGQMMEPLEWGNQPQDPPVKEWSVSRTESRDRRLILAAPISDEGLLELNCHLVEKYARAREDEQRWQSYLVDDAETIVVAYGTAARISAEAIESLRKKGHRAGLIRPISLWPFPAKAFAGIETTAGSCLVVEMSSGQMVDDVRLAVNGRIPVRGMGLGGGWIPTPEMVEEEILKS
ncbi:MAG: 3-methyl-2-oxobutanoate dehydrogenase subunit VorB [Chloroflexi bacterium]|nr:3-methyl-2-oxobutanoate dehydrogenase subunit VorB [Chloroflexota bacterium]